jgi:hypothetical protein
MAYLVALVQWSDGPWWLLIGVLLAEGVQGATFVTAASAVAPSHRATVASLFAGFIVLSIPFQMYAAWLQRDTQIALQVGALVVGAFLGRDAVLGWDDAST